MPSRYRKKEGGGGRGGRVYIYIRLRCSCTTLHYTCTLAKLLQQWLLLMKQLMITIVHAEVVQYKFKIHLPGLLLCYYSYHGVSSSQLIPLVNSIY